MSAAETAAAIRDAVDMLTTALKMVPDVRVQGDIGPGIDPPAVVLGPPSLRWEAGCSVPTSGRWLVYVVSPADELAVQRLLDLVPAVAAALDEAPDAAVVRADPGRYPSTNADLPAYEIQVDVSL